MDYPDAFTDGALKPPMTPVDLETMGTCDGSFSDKNGYEAPSAFSKPTGCELTGTAYSPNVFLTECMVRLQDPVCSDAPFGCDEECVTEGGNGTRDGNPPECCMRTPEDTPICIDWKGTSNPPIFGHSVDCDNCGQWNFGMACNDPGTGQGDQVEWAFTSTTIPEDCVLPYTPPGGDDDGGGGGFGDIHSWISSSTSNSITDNVQSIREEMRDMECEDGACLWECMDDGEQTYYGILIDDSDCARRKKPCGCPQVGPSGPCTPGDIIATPCGKI